MLCYVMLWYDMLCSHLSSGGRDTDRLGDGAAKLQSEVLESGLAVAAGADASGQLAATCGLLRRHFRHVACSNANTTVH